MKEFIDEDYHITSFKKFVDLVEKRHAPTTENPDGWIFRGHDDSKYNLIPSVGRLLGTERFPNKKAVLDAEKISFHNFEIATYHELKETNLFILLAVAQHHGLKTRLLDWTLSPLAALFFAVESESKVDGALFAFHNNRGFTNILRKKIHPFNVNSAAYQYLSIPSITPRITAQNGVFQMFNDPTKKFDDAEYLEKFIIPASAKQSIKIDLYNFGISYNNLFPDFDGLARTINFVYLNENPLY